MPVMIADRREIMSRQLLGAGWATVDQLLHASFGEWPPRGLDIAGPNNQTVRLLSSDLTDISALGVANIKGYATIGIDERAIWASGEGVAGIIGHEATHTLQGNHSYRSEYYFGNRMNGIGDSGPRSNRAVKGLFDTPELKAPHLQYLQQGIEIQARFHEIFADGYQAWRRLPGNREELLVALEACGIDRIPQAIRDELDTSPTIKQTRAAFPHAARKSRAAHQINNTLDPLDPVRRLAFWNQAAPALYSDLIEMYGDYAGRERFGLGTNPVAQARMRVDLDRQILSRANWIREIGDKGEIKSISANLKHLHNGLPDEVADILRAHYVTFDVAMDDSGKGNHRITIASPSERVLAVLEQAPDYDPHLLDRAADKPIPQKAFSILSGREIAASSALDGLGIVMAYLELKKFIPEMLRLYNANQADTPREKQEFFMQAFRAGGGAGLAAINGVFSTVSLGANLLAKALPNSQTFMAASNAGQRLVVRSLAPLAAANVIYQTISEEGNFLDDDHSLGMKSYRFMASILTAAPGLAFAKAALATSATPALGAVGAKATAWCATYVGSGALGTVILPAAIVAGATALVAYDAEMMMDTLRTYKQEDNRFVAARRDPPTDSRLPDIRNFANLPGVLLRASKYIDEGALNLNGLKLERFPDGSIKNFYKLDLKDPKNIQALEAALDKIISDKKIVEKENDSILPRWARWGDSAFKYNDAQSDIQFVRAAKAELQMFKGDLGLVVPQPSALDESRGLSQTFGSSAGPTARLREVEKSVDLAVQDIAGTIANSPHTEKLQNDLARQIEVEHARHNQNKIQ